MEAQSGRINFQDRNAGNTANVFLAFATKKNVVEAQ